MTSIIGRKNFKIEWFQFLLLYHSFKVYSNCVTNSHMCEINPKFSWPIIVEIIVNAIFEIGKIDWSLIQIFLRGRGASLHEL